MMASNAMTINWNYLLAPEKQFTSINFEDGARKGTVHKNKQKPKDGAPRPAREDLKCLIFPHTDEQVNKSNKNQ